MNALWEDIAVHDHKGVVFFVDSSVDILELAQAVSQDNLQYIQQMLEQKRLFRLSEDKKSALAQKICVFVIVQPYIFVELPS